MESLDSEQVRAIAESYQELLVPAMFEDCARRLVAVANPRPGDRVLDVACGTGVLTRAVADQLEDRESVVGLDMNPAMLSVAEELAPELEWHEGRAENLPFDAGTFDLALCQLSLMFFEDQRAALREMRRILKPDGRYAVAVFDALERVPAYERLIDIYVHVSDDEIEPFLRAPFSLSDADHVQALFSEAGFTSTRTSTLELKARFDSVRQLVLADVKGWFPLAGIELEDAQVEEVIERGRSALGEYIHDDGRVTFTMPLHVATNTPVVA